MTVVTEATQEFEGPETETLTFHVGTAAQFKNPPL